MSGYVFIDLLFQNRLGTTEVSMKGKSVSIK